MSELIDREAAILATWMEPSYTAPLNVLTEVRDRIKAIPAVPRWVRVEEPPKESGRFLIGCFFDDGSFGWEAAEYDGTEWENDHGCYCGPDYWMPIEPPKEDA